MQRGDVRRRREGGFTYFGVIIAVMLIGMTLAVAGVVARTEMQREREAQLIWVGHQYAAALTRYFNDNGGQLPQSLKELLVDERNAAVPKRYLRRLYPDPMTGTTNWNLLTLPGGGIYGVSSSSTAAPFKLKNFRPADASFEDASCYRAWEFVIVSRRLPIPVGSTASAC